MTENKIQIDLRLLECMQWLKDNDETNESKHEHANSCERMPKVDTDHNDD